jgi:hypothetical protein
MDAFVVIEQPATQTHTEEQQPQTEMQPPKKKQSSWEYYKRNPEKLKEHYKHITKYVTERYNKDDEFKERQKQYSREYYLRNAEYRQNKINRGKEAYKMKKLQNAMNSCAVNS